jgi:bacteriocin-like protein
MSKSTSDSLVKAPRTRIEDIPEAGATLSAEELQTVSGGMRAVGGCECSCCSTSCGCDCDLDQCDA